MAVKTRKKLIEVALPLEAINTASAREKSIRHGHPSTLHLWWARRPLAAAQAVIFAQMVDDPSTYVDTLLGVAETRRAVKRELKKRHALWEGRKATFEDVNAAAVVPDPATDPRLTVWEMVHHMIRVLEAGGEGAAAELAAKLGAKAEVARELAHRLYTVAERKKRAAEALSYNGLVQSWPEIMRLARESASVGGPHQVEMFGAA